jgi:hypothetical protein
VNRLAPKMNSAVSNTSTSGHGEERESAPLEHHEQFWSVTPPNRARKPAFERSSMTED